MRKKVPEEYKYLFENPKPLSECTLEERGIYAYFDHLTWQSEYNRVYVCAAIAGIVIGLVIVMAILLIREALL